MGKDEDELELDDNAPFGKPRKCTDVLCLLLLLVYVAAAAALLVLGMQNGDPRRLVYGYETSAGEVLQCGGDDKEKEKYTVYPRVEEDLLLQASKLATPWDIDFFGVCTDACPKTNDYVCNTEGDIAVASAMEALGITDKSAVIDPCLNTFQIPCFGQGGECCASSKISRGCFKILFDTVSVFYRCIPEFVYDESLVSATCDEYALVGEVASDGKCDGDYADPVCKNDDGWQKDLSKCNDTAPSYETACGKCMKLTTIVQVEETRPEDSNILYDSFNSGVREFERYMGDLQKSYVVIFGCGLGMGFGLGLGYVVSMYIAAGFMVWVSVIGMVLSSILFTLFCYLKAGIIDADVVTVITDLADDATGGGKGNSSGIQLPLTITNALTANGDFKQEFEYAAYTMTVLTLLLIVLVIALANRIRRAVKILVVASSAIRHNVGLTLLPFLAAIAVCFIFLFWAVASAFLASSGNLTVQIPGTDYEFDTNVTVMEVAHFEPLNLHTLMLVFLFFGLLWGYQFIHAFLVVSVSGTVGTWYWLDADHPRAKRPVLSSLYVTLRYHLGTIAFGALLVAIVQFIRYLVAYIDQKTKKMQKDNPIMKAVFCVLHCCLKCLERCVKFITTNAFVVCGLYGKNFCSSTKCAFGLIVANMAQVATLNFLSDILILMGQMGVSCSAALLAWYVIDNTESYQRGGENELEAAWFPVLATAVLAWPVGKAVLSIYSIAIETILISYCQDNHLGRKNAGHTRRTPAEFEDFVKNDAAGNPAAGGEVEMSEAAQITGTSM